MPLFQLKFDYYPDGRRARKRYYEQSGGGWVLKREHQFYYDRWQLLVERVTDNGTNYVNRYVWGLDMAGRQDGRLDQAVGGIGGLLAVERVEGAVTNTYLPIADHNGNIQAVVDGDTGAVVAEYVYSPYGTIIAASGPARDRFPLRFQSKYYEPETGFYYYGYRYYDPRTAKWLTRDPLGEQGGLNLTAFCNGDPVNGVDALGLAGYFFDGTGNDMDQFNEDGTAKPGFSKDDAPTHVAALFWMYSQIKVYEYGVGTRTEKWRGLANGKGARERLDRMFRNFERVYKNGTGDTDIDIFGFSRGAAEAREFANMIHDKYPEAKVRFLGVFDTVAQVGLPNEFNRNYGVRLDIPDSVQFTAHAVATHEYRDLFPLTSVAKRYGGVDDEKGLILHLGLMPFAPKRYYPSDYQELKSARYWEKPFAGAHSDIGGGYADGTNMRALVWMFNSGVGKNVPLDWESREFQKRRKAYKMASGWHDSRWCVDRIPFTDIGRYTRAIFSGNL